MQTSTKSVLRSFRLASAAAWPTLSLASLLLASFTLPAHAARSEAVDRISVWLGGYHADATGDLALTSADGSESTGDQRILDGTDTIKRARVDFLILESQGFSLDYFQFERRDARSIATGFTYGGVNYTASGELAARSKIDIGNVSYRWWTGGKETAFGIGIGATYLKFGIDYSARATLGGSSASFIDNNSKHVWAPLGTLGLRHRLTDQVRLYADLSGARKNGEENAGDVVNAAVGVEYFPLQNIGIGAEYGGTRIRYRYKNDDLKARLDLQTSGPSLFLRLRF